MDIVESQNMSATITVSDNGKRCYCGLFEL
ncbi:hypothetical protein BJV85_002021 [Clostridium acetobutylicum]|nr:hypothetical protein [Clostridium acetobutylicum]